MLDSLRFFLACFVVLGHLHKVEFIAAPAVWGFFVLSGFLITKSINKRSQYDASFLVFIKRRVMRIYPSYIASIFFAMIVIYLFGSKANPEFINQSLSIPETFREIFSNIFLIGTTTFGVGRIDSSLSPSSWALEVEFLMWIVGFFLLTSKLRCVLVIAFLSVLIVLVYLLVRVVLDVDVILASQFLYSFLLVSLFPYAIGAFLSYLPAIKVGIRWLYMMFGCCVFVSASILFVVYEVSATLGTLLSAPLMGGIVFVAFSIDSTTPLRSYWLKTIGDMAYPIYLLHWVCAYVAVLLLGVSRLSTAEPFTYPVLALSWLLLLLLAYLYVLYIERPLFNVFRK
ncbi:acyltransferase family protein [Aliamphritea ceti]|uniref:acyltransferase family protein n=1 Tax=Aliamphritea ceti TaxID=1524258 RepID=UPI0021C263CE|nr:acyltransferase [Aliamphritea ceti]